MASKFGWAEKAFCERDLQTGTASLIVSDVDTGALNVSGDAVIDGNMTVGVFLPEMKIEDPIIELGVNNATDALNLGYVGTYNGTSSYGLVRDRTTKNVYLYDAATIPTNTSDISALAGANLHTGLLTSSAGLDIDSAGSCDIKLDRGVKATDYHNIKFRNGGSDTWTLGCDVNSDVMKLFNNDTAGTPIAVDPVSDITSLYKLECDDVDSSNPTTLTVGKAIATKVEIADAGVLTEVKGDLQVDSVVDVSSGTLSIGETGALQVRIGKAGGFTNLLGTTTSIYGTCDFNSGTGNSYAMPLTRGTANQVMTSDGTGGSSWEDLPTGDITSYGDSWSTTAGAQFVNINDTNWRDLNNAFTNGLLQNFTATAAGILTYTGDDTATFAITIGTGIEGTTGGIPIDLGVSINNATPTRYKRFTTYGSTVPEPVELTGLFQLATNDTVRMKWRRVDLVAANPDFIFTTANVVAVQTPPSESGGGGGGNVVCNSSTDNALARFDGATGTLIQNSAATLDDTGTLTTANVDITSDFIYDKGHFEMYTDGNVATTSLSVALGWQKIALTSGTVMDDFTQGFTIDKVTNLGRATYTGTRTRKAHCGVTISVSCNNAGTEIDVCVYKNGVIVPSSVAKMTLQQSGRFQSTAIHYFTNFSTNDYVEVYAMADDTTLLTVDEINHFAMLLPNTV